MIEQQPDRNPRSAPSLSKSSAAISPGSAANGSAANGSADQRTAARQPSQMLSRRTLLRGLGIGMALPLFDTMLPRVPLLRAAQPAAAPSVAATGIAAPASGAAPLRMAFMYVPNGMTMTDWTPTTEGKLTELPPLLKNLEAFRDQLTVLSNLAQHHARANGDGGGDHARSMATFLTGMQAKKTSGADLRVGVSVDQVAAQLVGKTTRFGSLELGIDNSRQSGECDSGYSCAYSSNIAWKTETMPVPAETNPRLVFERLFAGDTPDSQNESQFLRDSYKKSVLDFVLDDATRLNKQLSRTDRRKLDEYMTSVRELEQRLVRSERESQVAMPQIAKPQQKPKDYGEHLKLMLDMLVLAWQTDSTRIATFPFANEGSGRSYTQVDVSEGHHELSHHGNDQKKLAKIAKINNYHLQHLAYFLEKLKSIREGEKTLLDNSMIVYGSCIGDGNRHNHDHLPIALLGGAGGAIQGGQHIKYKRETPLNNLWMTMLDIAGAKVDKLGDSTGRLTEFLA